MFYLSYVCIIVFGQTIFRNICYQTALIFYSFSASSLSLTTLLLEIILYPESTENNIHPIAPTAKILCAFIFPLKPVQNVAIMHANAPTAQYL